MKVRSNSARSFGYTVLEMLVVVAIVSILAMLIVPGLRGKILEHRQNEGRIKVLEIMQKQRQFKAFGNVHEFTTDLSELGYVTQGDGSVLSADEDALFAVTASVCPGAGVVATLAHCVQLTATPTDPNAGDSSWVMSTRDAEVREL